MKDASNRIRQPEEFENHWLRHELMRKLKEHGGTRAQWLRDIGFMGKYRRNGEVHLCYLLNGFRGLNFVKAVRLATAAGIDLSELQQLLLDGVSAIDESGTEIHENGYDSES